MSSVPKSAAGLLCAAFALAAVPFMPGARAQAVQTYDHEVDGDADAARLAGMQRMRIREMIRGIDWRLSMRNNWSQLPGHPVPRAMGITPTGSEMAGPLGSGWTLWSMYARSAVKDTRTAVANEGDTDSFTLGVDKELGSKIVAGVSFNHVRTSLDTYYNTGSSHTSGYTVSPYASIVLSEWLTLEATAGYVHNRERFSRSLPWSAIGRRHSNGYMLGASLNAARWYHSLLISGKVGIVASRDLWKAYVESDGTPHPERRNSLVQGSIEASASWWLDPVMPYAAVTYTRDLKTNDPLLVDRDDVTVTGGLAWYGAGEWEGLTADLSGSVVIGRQKQRNSTFSVGLRWNF